MRKSTTAIAVLATAHWTRCAEKLDYAQSGDRTELDECNQRNLAAKQSLIEKIISAWESPEHGNLGLALDAVQADLSPDEQYLVTREGLTSLFDEFVKDPEEFLPSTSCRMAATTRGFGL